MPILVFLFFFLHYYFRTCVLWTKVRNAIPPAKREARFATVPAISSQPEI